MVYRLIPIYHEATLSFIIKLVFIIIYKIVEYVDNVLEERMKIDKAIDDKSSEETRRNSIAIM